MAHTLPPLPYAHDALEPHIDIAKYKNRNEGRN